MKKVVSLFICCWISAFIYAQVNTDSLQKVWSDNSKPDCVRLAAIDELAWTARCLEAMKRLLPTPTTVPSNDNDALHAVPPPVRAA